MESILISLVFLVLLAFPALSIAAFVMAIRNQQAIRRLTDRTRPPCKNKSPASAAAVSIPVPASARESEDIPKSRVPETSPEPIPPPATGAETTPIPGATAATPDAAASLEQILGGRAAGIIGIAVLVTGIVFLVIHAIQNAWMGPGTRVVLGLLSGGGLIALGHLAERKSIRLRLLARLLTGGGAALFYFCIFAAYGLYELIGQRLCGGGLVLSALAVLGLALAYSSRTVALLGVIGAFITPLLIGDALDASAFSLSYVALVNAPVLGLALKQRWPSVSLAAFAFTAFYLVSHYDWMTRDANWTVGLALGLIFFLEFVFVALQRPGKASDAQKAPANLLLLTLNSLLLMGLLYYVPHGSGIEAWTGSAFLGAAVLHFLLARLRFRMQGTFRDETLALLIGALAFVALALPVQLDGAWVCLGWSLQGLILAGFARRIHSEPLKAGAVLLGLIGIGKSLAFDYIHYPVAPALFVNARFISGTLSALMLAGQARIFALRPSDAKGRTPAKSRFLLAAAVLGVTLAVFTDVFWILGVDSPWSWTLSTAAILGAGLLCVILASAGASCRGLATALLFAVPAKFVIFDLPAIYLHQGLPFPDPFLSGIFWFHLLMIAALPVFYRLAAGSSYEKTGFTAQGGSLHVLALLSVIVLVSAELERSEVSWSGMGITLWWALCALGLAAWGLARRSGAHRILSLALFALTALKVFLVDFSDLEGIPRIAAFMGAGVLLLLLSLLYQQLAGRLRPSRSQPQDGDTPPK